MMTEQNPWPGGHIVDIITQPMGRRYQRFFAGEASGDETTVIAISENKQQRRADENSRSIHLDHFRKRICRTSFFGIGSTFCTLHLPLHEWQNNAYEAKNETKSQCPFNYRPQLCDAPAECLRERQTAATGSARSEVRQRRGGLCAKALSRCGGDP
jgi:hypothetical protein